MEGTNFALFEDTDNFNDTDTNTNSTNHTCSGASDSELDFFENLSYGLGVLQLIICLIGLVANTLCIPVLKGKDLYTSTFNRLLIILAICDNLYLAFALLECLRTEIGKFTYNWIIKEFKKPLCME